MLYGFHYIGSKLYNLRSFIKEAKKKGCNRAISMLALKGLMWDKPILLAFHDKISNSAIVFGYMSVNSVGLRASIEFKKKLGDILSVTSFSLGGDIVNRECGSYTTGRSYSVSDSLAVLCEKIQKVSREVDESFSVFVSGYFTEIKHITLYPCKWFRGVAFIDIEENIINQVIDNNGDGTLTYILDYKQRTYKRKKLEQLSIVFM